MPQIKYPTSDFANSGGWTASNGGPVYAAIANQSTPPFALSGSNPSNTTNYTSGYGGVVPTTGTVTFRCNYQKQAGGARTLEADIRVLDGSGVELGRLVGTNISETPSTRTLTFSTSLITNWSSFRVVYNFYTTGGGKGSNAQVHFANMEFPDSPAPTTATNITTSNISNYSFSMNWTPGANTTGQRIESNYNGSWVVRATLSSSANSYNATTQNPVPSGTTESWRIVSLGTFELIGDPFSVTYVNIAAPANFRSSNITETSFTLAWDSATYASNYRVTVDGSQIYTGASLTTNTTGRTSATVYTCRLYATYTNDSRELEASPLQVRTSGGALTIWVQVGGVWKQAAAIKIQVGGVWKDAVSAKIQVGGVWKTIF